MKTNNTYTHNGDCDIACDEYIYTDCIVYRESIPFFGLEAGSTTTEIINKLVSTMQYYQSQLNNSNQTINDLQIRVSELENLLGNDEEQIIE